MDVFFFIDFLLKLLFNIETQHILVKEDFYFKIKKGVFTLEMS